MSIKRNRVYATVHYTRPVLGLGLGLAAVLVGSLPFSAALAQSTANAAPLTLASTTDSLLAGLPGVLIAGLALVFAIRERLRTKRLQQELDDANLASQSMTLQSSRYRAAAEHGSVGLWQLDSAGRTLYANPVMCQLLGVDRFTELKNINDARLLEPLHSDPTNAMFDDSGNRSYSATVRPLNNSTAHSVLIFERRIESRLNDHITVMRTVIDPVVLPCRLLDKQGDQLTVVAA